MTEVQAKTRRRIIRRPRLTKQLDENSSNIKLLVAPAGYGKTTLAEEWLSESKRGVWYRGGPASADVAALAAGLSKAVGEVVPDAGKRMRERIRSVGHPEEDVDLLAELFAEDIRLWPDDAWLAIDDYQFAMDSVASERFVDFLTQQTPIQILVTSRRRPAWATARRILYGEIQEVDRRALSMAEDEACAVLRGHADELRPIIDGARGWPAVIGLAALTPATVTGLDELPTALENYFAEEILQSLRAETQEAVCGLALAPSLTSNAVSYVLAPEMRASILQEAIRAGVLVPQPSDSYEIHPLLRRYLVETVLKHPGQAPTALMSRLAEGYISKHQWDDAFTLTVLYLDDDFLLRLFAAALDPLLREGRLATVGRWLEHTSTLHLDDPLLDLAEAEIAFRHNDHSKAEQLAVQASRHLGPALLSRALIRAGYAAVLASREADALGHFRRARSAASTISDRREALLGEYYAASELGEPTAEGVLEKAVALGDHSAEGHVRVNVMRLARANRSGGVREAIEQARSKMHLLERIADPLVRTSFLHALATALNLSGNYQEACTHAEEILEEARRFRLDLPVPHGLLDRAIAELGLRKFDRCRKSITAARAASERDRYVQALASLASARLNLSHRRFQAAQEDLSTLVPDQLSAPVRAEIAASRALVRILLGNENGVEQLIDLAKADVAASVEAKVLIAGAEVLLLPRGETRDSQLRALWRLSTSTGNVDSFVCLYRAAPRLLLDLKRIEGETEELLRLVDRANDVELARYAGLGPAASELTPREQEVAELLRQGHSNSEIAASLYISQATVKVHLRHIYEKLGVANRASAVARLS